MCDLNLSNCHSCDNRTPKKLFIKNKACDNRTPFMDRPVCPKKDNKKTPKKNKTYRKQIKILGTFKGQLTPKRTSILHINYKTMHMSNSWISLVMTDEFSVRFRKITTGMSVSSFSFTNTQVLSSNFGGC